MELFLALKGNSNKFTLNFAITLIARAITITIEIAGTAKNILGSTRGEHKGGKEGGLTP